MATCKYCQTECKALGLSMHERYCKENPNRLTKSTGGAKRGSTPWNKGKSTSDSTKIKLSIALIGKSKGTGLTDETEKLRRSRISKTMKDNKNSGGLRPGSGRGLKGYYESPSAGRVYLRSSYELRYAMWLDRNLIKWKQPMESFEYEYDGRVRRYYPDFYLIETNEYIELKGFKTKQDEAKWKAFPNKLRILYGKDIEKLEEYSSGLRDLL
jgi:hypothetical protein